MSDGSAIEWTDATWNPVRGCTKVSAGCRNCYAETFAERWRGIPGHPFEHGFDLRLVPEKLDEPLRWRKPRRVFVNSMSDLFHEDVPFDFAREVLVRVMATPQHTFQVLTKRAARMREFFTDYAGGFPILPNLWLGVSVEDQRAADERIPHLLATSAAVRFLSCEPLLGPVRLPYAPEGEIGWVIVGGESGHGARPMNLAWAGALVSQCRAARVPVFVKQLGRRAYERAEILGAEGHAGKDLLDVMSRPPLPAQREGWTRVTTPDGEHLARYWRFRHPKGGDPAEWPADLRVREFPAPTPETR